ncbi:hypothetical protein JTE90_018725 [Oedothorax gibbosus]|uniref:Uncharacterized protein n=1 Tax=Oedothorax gibbosus TaxID=931172 RepID=A0AAV6UJM8_9ARAC|nr:hypothetical protein JTE90_018725 [Oedothorax gibbosus]
MVDINKSLPSKTPHSSIPSNISTPFLPPRELISFRRIPRVTCRERESVPRAASMHSHARQVATGFFNEPFMRPFHGLVYL